LEDFDLIVLILKKISAIGYFYCFYSIKEMELFIKNLVLFSFIFHNYYLLISQETGFGNSAEKEVITLDSCFQSVYRKQVLLDKPEENLEFIRFLSSASTEENYVQAKLDLITAKQSFLNSEIGLSIRADYLDNQLSNVFNLEDNLNYKRRAQAGLEWNLLQGGWIENRTKSKALAFDAYYERFKLQTDNSKSLYLRRFNQTILVFNQQKLWLLEERKRIMTELLAIEKRLYFLKHVSKEELLDSQMRLSEAQAMINIYEPYNKLSDSGEKPFSEKAETIPLFDLNYEKVFQEYHPANIDSLTQLLFAKSDLLNKWYNDLSVNAYSRYNRFTTIGSNNFINTSYVSFGLSLRYGIPHNLAKREAVIEAENKVKLNELEKYSQIFEEELLNDLYEFRYKLKQYLVYYYKFKRVQELLRKEEVKRTLHETYFSPVKALKLVDDAYRIQVDLADLKQNLYLKLLRIHQKIPVISLQELMKPLDMSSFETPSSRLKREIYVWTSTFESASSAFLSHYLEYNNFSRCIIAHQAEDSLRAKKKELIQWMGEKGNASALLFGQNKLMQEKDISFWFTKELSGYDFKHIDALHLDVEPHTFDSWKTDKNYLVGQYLGMVKEVKKVAEKLGLKLEVSVPLHYPPEVMDTLFSLVDRVYLMCYENIDQSYLQRKIGTFDNYKGKVTVVASAKDFANRSEIETFIDLISEDIPLDRICIHDLGWLIQLDKEEIKK
jgi:hypothetical protein